ncbi:carbohydrate ABC transporter permease [Microcella daejeonensis]|uniref:Carbohydrate ABC transporter permease n=1 Tax=Microcella daejeonensis TaxID=2994971 RepID=A0A9E8MIX8_9MICO|nr:carbohydrate ABC transporter permease [Microcella daejeonensis]WAB80413.1 carbohydrate ABC transporter permease [Microcella daejeonensis]WAB85027.1 carbohydrate ABC transporter permease [Microcella daejeonensis]
MTSTITARRKQRDPRDRRSGLLTGLVWLGVAYFLLPLLWLTIASTKDNTDLFSTFGFFFGDEFNFFANLESLFAFRDGVFWRWTGNTILYAGVSAVGATALATAAGYAFAKFEFPGRRFIFSAVLGSIMIPATALALPTYLVFANLGLVNTPWAIIIPSIVSPFGVYLMRVYAADSVPDSLIEAARIDGASELRIFVSIGLRLMGPGMVTVFLFSLVGVWNNYFLPLIMLSSSDLYPLTVGLAQLQALSTGGGGSTAVFSTVIAGSFVSILPLVVAFLYLQRYWQSGLAAGSTKE